MPRLLKPNRLRPGDRVAIVSPSWGGPGAIPRRYEMGRRELEERFGLHVVAMPHALADPDWVRRNPRARAEDIEAAFRDPSIAGVITSIGGDDSIRVLPFIDPRVMHDHPKIFMGYSDTTTLHTLALHAGLQTFYGPSVMAGIAENAGMFAYTERWFRATLMSAEPVGLLDPSPEWTDERLEWTDPSLETRRRTMRPSSGWRWVQGAGIAEGHLLGGCLDVLEFLKGTRWWPPLDAWHGAVFYWETSEETPTPKIVERWLRNYASQGIFDVIAAMLIGRPCRYPDEERQEFTRMLAEFAGDEIGRPDLPIVSDLDFGHTDPMFILPNGGRIVVDCERRMIILPEPAVE